MRRVRLKPISIFLAVLGGLTLLGGYTAFSVFIYSPLLQDRCSLSCTSAEQAVVQSGYAATSITEGCECDSPEGFNRGHFFFQDENIDWVALIMIRVSAIGLISLLVILPLSKAIQRIEKV
ncbi:MAG: hypothetical protein RH862_13180 [Leptospiraceae bacterium]